MKNLIAIAALAISASTHAQVSYSTDGSSFYVNIDPNGLQQFLASNVPAGTESYGPDSLSFTIPVQTCYPGYGYGPYCWTYTNQITFFVSGALTSECQRFGCQYQHVTMPGTDTLSLMAVDASGNQTPAIDVNGNVVPITYSPLNVGMPTQVDRWVVSGALPAGNYAISGMAGTACGQYSRYNGACAGWGGLHTGWGAHFTPSFTYCSPYTSPPCAPPPPHDD